MYLKDVQLCGIPCCICMFEGLSSIERLWIMMLDSLSKPQVMPRSVKNCWHFCMTGQLFHWRQSV